jgi:hypothetical protein
MIVAQSQSGALRHARRQQIEYRINQLNSELNNLIAELRNLVAERDEMDVAFPTPSQEKKRKHGGGRGRTLFTEEVYQQIPHMMDEGMDREEIAEAIGCTVQTLIVRCCQRKIGIPRPQGSTPFGVGG